MSHKTLHTALTWTVVFIVVVASTPVGAQNNRGELVGYVLDPDGKPTPGFKLVFRAVGGDMDLVSSPSDENGKYSIELLSGLQYVLTAAIAPDGSRLEVPPLPPIPVENGSRQLDVQFHYPETSAGVAEVAAAPAGTTAGKKKKGRGSPWWQIGAAVGATVLFGALVFDRETEEQIASPHRP